jgi:catechol 2,3-dioxygenase-like lactoylglutathione lyase family enzyme
MKAGGIRPSRRGGRVTNRIHRPHRHCRSGPRWGEAVLRRPHAKHANQAPTRATKRGLQHIAFVVESRGVVREAYQWACAHNAEILNEPREFPEYGQHYATYWLDPHGFVLEAVCHGPDAA